MRSAGRGRTPSPSAKATSLWSEKGPQAKKRSGNGKRPPPDTSSSREAVKACPEALDVISTSRTSRALLDAIGICRRALLKAESHMRPFRRRVQGMRQDRWGYRRTGRPAHGRRDVLSHENAVG